LFFVTAGYFAAMLVRKRGLAGMLKNRVARVLLPLLLLAPPLIAGMGLLTRHAAATVQHPSPVLRFLRQHDVAPLPPTLSHLWFLAYLMWFYLLVWIAQACGFQLRAKLTPAIVAAVAPLLLVVPLWTAGSPFPAPEFVLPQLWALVFFGLYFAFGYWLFDHPAFWEGDSVMFRAAGLAAILAYGALCWLWSLRSEADWVPWARSFCEAYAGVCMTLACLHAARALLSETNALLRYAAETSYWIYLIHLPVLLAIQYRLMDFDAAWPFKLALSVVGTLAIGVLSYETLVKRTLLGVLLNGGQLARQSESVVEERLGC
jgi:peptidoglycan/LPS O-acetylase OafA/YrhL